MDSELILLSSYNGKEFIEKQLNSLFAQNGVNLHLLIRDDGSKDNTVTIIKTFQYQYPNQITLIEGENIGPNKSFRALMEKAVETPYNYFAFCDQDDLWFKNKLMTALESLRKNSKDKPSLFFSKFQEIDSQDQDIPTFIPPYKFSLGEALVLNPSVGCTQVFNRALLLEALKAQFPFPVLHDWWIYAVCLTLRGSVSYEKTPLIGYLQHSHNVVGGGKRSKFQKIAEWIHTPNKQIRRLLALQLLETYNGKLQADEKILLLLASQSKSFKGRLRLLLNRKKFKTYMADANKGFILNVIFGKF